MSGGAAGAWRPAVGGPISVRVPVDDLSRVGEARRAADAIARACGLEDLERGELGLVVTEAATNLARHARGGVIFLRDLDAEGLKGVEILAVDSGPGMQDVARSTADGYTTGSGSPGTGLGAMRRKAGHFDIYSLVGSGTALVARVVQGGAETLAVREAALVDIGVVCRPIDGETVCGDGWAVARSGDRTMVLVVDGLGHGPSAAEAADLARDIFRAMTPASPRETLVGIHEALRSTRGAAVAVVLIEPTDEGAIVTLSGAGNVSASVVAAGGTRALPSMNGTAGLQLRRVQEFTATMPFDGRLVLHTDGITSRWRLDAYPGVLDRDPAIIAALLSRDFNRGRDDATVLALSLRPRRSSTPG